MKEIIASCVYLASGIYASEKLSNIAAIIFYVSIFLFDIILKVKRQIFMQKRREEKEDTINHVKPINYEKIYKDIFSINTIIRFIIFLLIFSYGMYSQNKVNNHKNLLAESLLYKSNTYVGKIITVKEKKNNYETVVNIPRIKERLQIYIDKKMITNLMPGDEVKIKGMITNIDMPSNLGTYNEIQNKHEKKIFYNFKGKVLKVTCKENYLESFIYRLRTKLARCYDQILDAKSSSIIKAMVIGEGQTIEESIKNLFKEGGVFHILAISGMHVCIITGFIDIILKKRKANIRHKSLIKITILLIYTFLTGMSISTVRAAIMCIFAESARMLDREYDSFVGLTLAAGLILLYNPALLFSLSFILSFSASIALKVKIKFSGLLKSQEGNISIFLFMLPIGLYNFYTIQGLSIVANILILPFVSTLIIVAILSLSCSFVNENLGIILGKIVQLILYYYEIVLKFLKKSPISNIVVGKISIFQVILFALCYYFLYKHQKCDKYLFKDSNKKIRYKILLIIVVLFLSLSFIKGKDTYVTFIDVAHGDATLFYSSDRSHAALVDGGGKSDKKDDVGKYTIFPYLTYEGITHLDAAICTHPDRDHIKGILELTDLIRIKTIMIARCMEKSDDYKELIKKCKEKNIEIAFLAEGDYFDISNIRYQVLYPPAKLEGKVDKISKNNSSLVILVSVFQKEVGKKTCSNNTNKKAINLLLTGDIEKEAEKYIIENMNVNKHINLMKVPHHGSDTSSTYEFTNIVKPDIAVVSGDYNNIKKYYKKTSFKYKNSIKLNTYNEGMIKIRIKK